MSDITAFLLARIAEREEVARAVIAERDAIEWRPGAKPAPGMDFWQDVDSSTPHVALDAELVLADCQAMRNVVALHSPTSKNVPVYSGSGDRACTACVDFHADMDCENMLYPCPTLRQLAAPCASHDEYDQSWRL